MAVPLRLCRSRIGAHGPGPAGVGVVDGGKGTTRPCFVWALPSCPPCGRAGLGVGVLRRGGAVGALLTVAFLFTGIEYPSLRVLAVPLSNLPLLALAYYHLF